MTRHDPKVSTKAHVEAKKGRRSAIAIATRITTSTAPRQDNGLPQVANQPANSILKRVRIGSATTNELSRRRR
jgi:hypothetical protein